MLGMSQMSRETASLSALPMASQGVQVSFSNIPISDPPGVLSIQQKSTFGCTCRVLCLPIFKACCVVLWSLELLYMTA